MSSRKYVLTIGSPTPRRPFDYERFPMPSLYTELPFDSLGIDELSPEGEFAIAGLSFCLSGDFACGRKNTERLVVELGGHLHESVAPYTDFVIVGERPSKGWKFGNYGTKINRALEIRQRNPNPLLVREVEFIALTTAVKSPAGLLDQLLGSSLRSTFLLDLFADGYTNGWACCVPACFRSALDICQTTRVEDRVEHLTWTQGKNFEFDLGDTFYDCREAYSLSWGEALQHMGFCLQIRENFADVVGFDLLVPDEAKTRLVVQSRVRVSQAEFVRLLITGSCEGHEA